MSAEKRKFLVMKEYREGEPLVPGTVYDTRDEVACKAMELSRENPGRDFFVVELVLWGTAKDGVYTENMIMRVAA